MAPQDPEVDPPGARTVTDTFVVTGMTCASCSLVTEKVVGRLSGVTSANVNLASEKLTVVYDENLLGPAEIIAAVEAAGYGAAPLNEAPGLSESGHIMLSLTGMTCAACAAVLEKVLGKVPGVYSAAVNLATEIATVDFDPMRVGPDELLSAVKNAGSRWRPSGSPALPTTLQVPRVTLTSSGSSTSSCSRCRCRCRCCSSR
jgi:copper ion binding protein